MDYENRFGSKGATGAALGTGIAGLSLGVLNAMGGCGLLGNVLGGNCANGCHENQMVTRYDAQKDARIAELETEVKLRDANTFTINEMNKLRNYVDTRFAGVDAAISQQAVFNATNTATLGCMQNQIAQLMSLTKCVIPTTSICPEPMPLYNSWTAPTAAATT